MPKDQVEAKKKEFVPITKRTLHWKAFFLGILVVLLIELLAVNVITSSNDDTIPTLTPSKTPPSPTNPPPIPTNWKTYTDLTNGFTLAYPADTYAIDARPQMSLGTIHINIVNDVDQNANLGQDFAPSDYANLKTAILRGSQFSSLQPGEKDRFESKQLGATNFVRVYPVSNPGCLCDEIAYITRLPHAFLVLSMTTETTTQGVKTTDEEAKIITEFGDIEKVLATLIIKK